MNLDAFFNIQCSRISNDHRAEQRIAGVRKPEIRHPEDPNRDINGQYYNPEARPADEYPVHFNHYTPDNRRLERWYRQLRILYE